jgi:hypothetical protein
MVLLCACNATDVLLFFFQWINNVVWAALYGGSACSGSPDALMETEKPVLPFPPFCLYHSFLTSTPGTGSSYCTWWQRDNALHTLLDNDYCPLLLCPMNHPLGITTSSFFWNFQIKWQHWSVGWICRLSTSLLILYIWWFSSPLAANFSLHL